MVISIIGGASGVGKTTLLKSICEIRQINTGDLFKAEITIKNRDEIKKGDWSIFEEKVAMNMEKIACESIKADNSLIFDTHFAAKIFNKNYRIGIKEEFLHSFWQSVISQKVKKKIKIFVILITSDPYLLLTRRRLDLSRKRELIPSDCYNDLRCNDVYSRRYLP